jgi:hypothetical protein
MIILVDLAIGLLVISVAGLILGVGLKLIKENSKKSDME